MAKIVSISPLGFNIKTTEGVIFAGKKLFPPFAENIDFDLKNNPHRWVIEYEKKLVLKAVEDHIEEVAEVEDLIEEVAEDVFTSTLNSEVVPELEKSDTKKSEVSVAATVRTKSRRRKIINK